MFIYSPVVLIEPLVGRLLCPAAKGCHPIQYVLSLSPARVLTLWLVALSPFQAKAAPQMLRNYLFNGYRRLSAEALFFMIPFGAGGFPFCFSVGRFRR